MAHNPYLKTLIYLPILVKMGLTHIKSAKGLLSGLPFSNAAAEENICVLIGFQKHVIGIDR